MLYKQALLDLGYEYPELRPHLRKILAHSQEEELLNEIRRLEDGRITDKGQWRDVYKILTSMNLNTPMAKSLLGRIAKIRDRTRKLSPFSWGMGGFAQLVSNGEYSKNRFPSKLEKNEGELLKLFLYSDGSYKISFDTGKGYISNMPYATKHAAMEKYRILKDQISHYDTGFDEDDLPW